MLSRAKHFYCYILVMTYHRFCIVNIMGLCKSFLADRTNGCTSASVLRLSSSVCLSVCMEGIVAKRCILDQKLLLTAYRKSSTGNRLVPNWMTLTFVRGCIKVMSTIVSHSTLNILETVRDRGLLPRTTDRKWHMGYQMVMWLMTSRDLENSNLRPQ